MPETNQRVAELLLRIRTEKQAIAQAKQDLGSYRREFDQFKTETEKVNSALERQALAIQRQQVAQAQAASTTRQAADAERTVARETESATSIIQRQTQALRERMAVERSLAEGPNIAGFSAAGPAGPRRGAALQAFGREARLSVPAFPIPGTGLSTEFLFRVSEVAGRLNLSFKDLAIGGGAAVAAIIAITVAIQKFNSDVEKIAAELRGALFGRAEAARILASGDSEDIVRETEERRRTLAGLQAERDKLQADLNRQFEELRAQRPDLGENINTILEKGFSPQALVDIIANPVAEGLSTVFRAGPLGDAINKLADLDKNIAETDNSLIGLNEVYDIHLKLLSDQERAKRAEEQQDLILLEQLRTQLQLRDQDAESVRQQIEALEAEQQANLALITSWELSEEAQLKLEAQTIQTSVALEELRKALPEKEAIEAATFFANRLREGIVGGAKGLVQGLTNPIDTLLGEGVAESLAKIGELQREAARRIDEIKARLAEQIAEAGRSAALALAEAQRDADIARSEAIRKSERERLKIIQGTQDAIARILRRAGFEERQAIQNRDAIALDAARERAKEEIQTEVENRDQRLQELSDDLAEQNRVIDMRLREQQRTIDLRYQEQVRRAQLAAQRSIEAETARLNAELQVQYQGINKILEVEQARRNAEVNIANQGAIGVLQVAQNFWQAMVNQANAARAAATAAQVQPFKATTVTSTQVTGAGGVGFYAGLASGGRILSDGLYYGHRGEMVTNPARGQLPGGGGLMINIYGERKRQIMKQLALQLDDFFLDTFGGN